LRPESLMMSYGYRPKWSEGAVKAPIFQTSTFVFETAEEGKAFFELAYGLREKGVDETLGLIYSRLNNPTLEILEDRLKLWDGAEGAAAFESGMASIATTMFTFLRPGDAVVFSEPVYGGTEFLLHHLLPEWGIRTIPFRAGPGSAALEEAAERASEAGPLAMIYLETPANPTNDLVDIAACAELARRKSTKDHRVLVAVDNTFLGPVFQHPLAHGADLVIYSLTKFVGGHSDVIAGACVGRSELIVRLKSTRTILGSTADPWTAWLLLRSLETLKLRMTAQMKSARHIADFLLDHPKVDRVHYLGHLTEDDPSFEVYRRQCLAPGSMISFEVRGGEEEAFRFLNALALVKLAVSLGGTESLAQHPGCMTHADVPPEEREGIGITPNLVRLSVGIEHYEDVMADLGQALAQV
ncbi:MAG TPA: cystathionine gamma-synthase family protein, partial [Longimicrobiales bacterium]